jgi:ABC-type nitrate/sulfonate/bicarbonate transport system substrate-binding protein
VAAMQGSRIHAGILSYPSIGRAKKLGHRTILDIATLGISYASTGMTTRGRLIREDPDLVRRYMTAQVEAIARAKQDKNLAMSVMGKYLRVTDSELLSESYDLYVQKHLLKVPLPTVDALKPVLEELAPRNPKAKEVDPRRLFDDSFVRQLQSSGYIDSLYR